MAGLIAAKLPDIPDPDGTMPGAPGASSATYDPERITLDQNTDTVEGRLNSIINKNSDLMQSARTASDQTMNSRGLINSSLAQGAAQKAVLDTALPIATSDAAAMQATKSSNQQAANAALGLGATGLQTQQQIAAQTAGQQTLQAQQGDIQSQLQAERGQIEVQLQTADAATKLQLQQRQADIDTQLQNLRGTQASQLSAQESVQAQQKAALDAQNAQALATLQGNQAKDLATLTKNFDVLIQTSASASQLYSQMSQNIATILADPNMTQANKQTQVTQLINLLHDGLTVLGGAANIDLTGLLNFSTSPSPGQPGYYEPPPPNTILPAIPRH